MIIGIGMDIIEISRIAQATTKEGFLLKYFTPRERKDFSLLPHPQGRIAGVFAAKEALVKALGIGFREGVQAQSIEIIRDGKGKPYLSLTGAALEHFRSMGGTSIHITVSHAREYATAMVVLEGSAEP